MFVKTESDGKDAMSNKAGTSSVAKVILVFGYGKGKGEILRVGQGRWFDSTVAECGLLFQVVHTPTQALLAHLPCANLSASSLRGRSEKTHHRGCSGIYTGAITDDEQTLVTIRRSNAYDLSCAGGWGRQTINLRPGWAAEWIQEQPG